MSEQAKLAPAAIVVEHTPNPDALMLLLGRACLEPGLPAGVDLPDRERALRDSPLASALFGIDGVARVFLGADFISVTKVPDVNWRTLGPELLRVTAEQFNAGTPVLSPGFQPPAPAHDGELAYRVRSVLDSEVRPLVASHGGDVEFLGCRNGVVELALHGACAGCPAAALTLRNQIESRLRAAVPEIVEIVAR